ncbi:MAG TPA: polysaccharide biosynthesis tyrosine autokinase, partial [Thermoanaerobaculia bacterium]|nr:polysaccharide biosynthesis tyrosine autokinase [Thermoanaerobaculia bacterium]
VNFLAAKVPLEDIVQESEVPNLFFIESGPIPPNPSELLASDRMGELMETVRKRFDFVILDSPPVMAVADAMVLGTIADGVVLCIHGGTTVREMVSRAAQRLRQANTPVLGALLNNLDLRSHGYRFSKEYYEYYYEQQDQPRTRRSARAS